MTDKEIGRAVREIAEGGDTARVKKNKDGLIILKDKSTIVKRDVISTFSKSKK